MPLACCLFWLEQDVEKVQLRVLGAQFCCILFEVVFAFFYINVPQVDAERPSLTIIPHYS